MLRMVNYFIIVAAILSFTSCTRIFGQKYQSVSFNSNRAGTNVFVDGVFMGTIEKNKPVQVDIPIATDLGGRDRYNIRYESYGFAPALFTIEKTPNVAVERNEVLCVLDKFPGFLLILPPLISQNTGVCGSFNYSYYRQFGKSIPHRPNQSRTPSSYGLYKNHSPDFLNAKTFENKKIGKTEDGHYYSIDTKQEKLDYATEDKIKSRISKLKNLYGVDAVPEKVEKIYK